MKQYTFIRIRVGILPNMYTYCARMCGNALVYCCVSIIYDKTFTIWKSAYNNPSYAYRCTKLFRVMYEMCVVIWTMGIWLIESCDVIEQSNKWKLFKCGYNIGMIVYFGISRLEFATNIHCQIQYSSPFVEICNIIIKFKYFFEGKILTEINDIAEYGENSAIYGCCLMLLVKKGSHKSWVK